MFDFMYLILLLCLNRRVNIVNGFDIVCFEFFFYGEVKIRGINVDKYIRFYFKYCFNYLFLVFE